jgi:hypothetical protein
MDTHEWLDREKLINWMETGQSVHWAMHKFEYALVFRALEFYKSKFKLNPVAQEVFDHLMMQYEESEIELEYPTEKALRRTYGSKTDL